MAEKSSKPKMIRDSFTMPKEEYALIDTLKARAVDGKRPAKKSELLRAGLRALQALSAGELVRALDALPTVKTGRPKGDNPKAAQPVAVKLPLVAPSVKTPKPAAKKRAAQKPTPKKAVAPKKAAKPAPKKSVAPKTAVKKAATRPARKAASGVAR